MDGSFSSITHRTIPLVDIVNEEWMQETLTDSELLLANDPLEDKEDQIPSILSVLANETNDRKWIDLGLQQFE